MSRQSILGIVTFFSLTFAWSAKSQAIGNVHKFFLKHNKRLPKIARTIIPGTRENLTRRLSRGQEFQHPRQGAEGTITVEVNPRTGTPHAKIVRDNVLDTFFTQGEFREAPTTGAAAIYIPHDKKPENVFRITLGTKGGFVIQQVRKPEQPLRVYPHR